MKLCYNAYKLYHFNYLSIKFMNITYTHIATIHIRNVIISSCSCVTTSHPLVPKKHYSISVSMSIL